MTRSSFYLQQFPQGAERIPNLEQSQWKPILKEKKRGSAGSERGSVGSERGSAGSERGSAGSERGSATTEESNLVCLLNNRD